MLTNNPGHRPEPYCRASLWSCRALPIEVAMMTASVRANSGLRLASSLYTATARPATSIAAALGKPAIPASVASISSASSLSSSTTTSSSSPSSRSYSSSSRLSPLLSSSSSLSSLSRRSGLLSLNPTQVRTMAVDSKKIKVKNPVVELDGDEVCHFFLLSFKLSLA